MLRSTILLILFSFPCVAQNAGEQRGLLSSLRNYLREASDSGFGFSVLVSVDGQIVLQQGYGSIDSTGRQCTEHTLFNIASITKSMTATAVFSLRSRGLLSLNDSLLKFFQDVPEDKRSVTIGQLLTHTSGFAQHYVADGIADRDTAVQRILDDELMFLPGTGFSYSNENYQLVGAIVEVTMQQNFEDVTQSLVLSKANMLDTRFWADERPATQHIASMVRTLDPAVLTRNWGYIASNGMFSNVVDLFSWFTALTNGAILDSASLHDMWTVQHHRPETGICSGWYVSSSMGEQEIWTRGNEDWGHNSVLRWFPKRNVLVIVLSNSGERGNGRATANRYISDGIVRIIFE